jgi:hypothetical protein
MGRGAGILGGRRGRRPAPLRRGASRSPLCEVEGDTPPRRRAGPGAGQAHAVTLPTDARSDGDHRHGGTGLSGGGRAGAGPGARRLTLVRRRRRGNLQPPPPAPLRARGRRPAQGGGRRRATLTCLPGLEIETRTRRVGPDDVEPLLARHTPGHRRHRLGGGQVPAQRRRRADRHAAGLGGWCSGAARRCASTRAAPCLRCLYGTAPREDEVPTCARAGVLGSLAGVLGALQASLASDLPSPAGRSTLHVVDGPHAALPDPHRALGVPDCPGCGARA